MLFGWLLLWFDLVGFVYFNFGVNNFCWVVLFDFTFVCLFACVYIWFGWFYVLVCIVLGFGIKLWYWLGAIYVWVFDVFGCYFSILWKVLVSILVFCLIWLVCLFDLLFCLLFFLLNVLIDCCDGVADLTFVLLFDGFVISFVWVFVVAVCLTVVLVIPIGVWVECFCLFALLVGFILRFWSWDVCG